jgi:rSAM/selenodomain-associated transferase 1
MAVDCLVQSIDDTIVLLLGGVPDCQPVVELFSNKVATSLVIAVTPATKARRGPNSQRRAAPQQIFWSARNRKLPCNVIVSRTIYSGRLGCEKVFVSDTVSKPLFPCGSSMLRPAAEDRIAAVGGAAFCGIAVMAKASKPGRTKTRLSPPLTGEEAALFNTAFLRDIAANLLDAGRRAPVAGYMAYGPPGEGAFFDFLPDGIDIFEAWHPNFGDCLSGTIVELLGRGHGAACVLNADSPTLPQAFLLEAAGVLAAPGDRAVLGPSNDGGYYLLGLKRHHARLFEDIAWSTETVAAQTFERAAEIGLAVHVLPTWYDVDDAHSLAILRRELFEGRAFGDSDAQPAEALHTRALIERLDLGGGLGCRFGTDVFERSVG